MFESKVASAMPDVRATRTHIAHRTASDDPSSCSSLGNSRRRRRSMENMSAAPCPPSSKKCSCVARWRSFIKYSQQLRSKDRFRQFSSLSPGPSLPACPTLPVASDTELADVITGHLVAMNFSGGATRNKCNPPSRCRSRGTYCFSIRHTQHAARTFE